MGECRVKKFCFMHSPKHQMDYSIDTITFGDRIGNGPYVQLIRVVIADEAFFVINYHNYCRILSLAV